MAKITKRPSVAVRMGTPTRGDGNWVMTTKWTVPAALVSSNKNNRATSLEIQWFLGIAGSDPKFVKTDKNERHTSHSINLNNVTASGKKYTRASFYPFGPVLSYVTTKVIPKNGQGKGPVASGTRYFGAPRKPSIGDLEFNTENGKVSVVITTNPGADHYERYDTKYWITVTNTRTNTVTTPVDSDSTSTEFSTDYDVVDYQQLDPDNEYVAVTFGAYARGFAGNSETAWATYYVSYPKTPTILSVKSTSKDMTGKTTVQINTNSSTEHPVDRVRLEYLVNVPYRSAQEIPGDENWVSSNIIDDANCTALSIPVAAVIPNRGKHSWVRVKSYHASEDVLFRYSAPVEIEDLFTPAPTAADDNIFILNAVAGKNGQSAVVTLGWNADGHDDSTGTELTWSDEEDTWKSTESPNTYTFSWSDGKIYDLTKDTQIVPNKKYYTRSGAGTADSPYVYTQVANPVAADLDSYYEVIYNDSATIVIKNLSESTKYYIKARRYLEDTELGVTTYSEYTQPATILTSEKPQSIVASFDRYVSEGEAFTIRWTFSGNGLQTNWKIVQNTWYDLSEDEEAVVGKMYYTNDGTGYVLVTDIYKLTSDVQIIEGKKYYTRSGDGTEQSPYVYTEVEDPDVSEIATYFDLKDPTTEGWYEQFGGAIIQEGDNSLGAIQLTTERARLFAVNNSLTFRVEISTGSEPVVSPYYTITIVDPPEIEIDAPDMLTTNALSFDVTSTRESDLIVIVNSQGGNGQFPQGILSQVSGDTIHSDVYSPDWTKDGDVYTATINLPTGLDFWDLCRYTLTVTAVDQASALRSQPVTQDFEIAWAYKAPDPEDAVTLTVIDETDEDGDHRQAVQIDLTPPVGSYFLSADTSVGEDKVYYERTGAGTEESPYVFTEVEPASGDNPSTEGWYELRNDVYDIYRMDVEKPTLIGKGFPLTLTTVDEYAPFGHDIELRYRIAIRTEDGDVEFADIDYTAECENIRFDWASGFLELPYGLTMGDTFKKDVDIRKHMNGETDGYWNSNIERKSSLSSDVIKIIQEKDIERARLLARYAGPVFVRLPYGSAYQADVQVTDLSRKNEAVMHAAFDATEVGVTQEFSLPIPFVLDEE